MLLRFQVVDESLPPGRAKEELERALDLAARAITEGRDTVQGLRSSTVEINDLARAIDALGEELAGGEGNETNSNRVESSVEVEGTPRDLHPILRDEVYRIAGEALRNAFRHAQARRIDVAIGYGERQFRLRVRDDGKGIDPEVLDGQARAGHFGLPGMRERAELIGGEPGSLEPAAIRHGGRAEDSCGHCLRGVFFSYGGRGPFALSYKTSVAYENAVCEKDRDELMIRVLAVDDHEVFRGGIASAGNLTSTSTTSRQLQFALKVLW